MAAPASVTIDDLSGKYVMNKTLSTTLDPLLTLQALSWLTRRAISLATVTLTVHHHTVHQQTPPNSKTSHIDITQHLTGGLRASDEDRQLDWVWRGRQDRIFGNVRGRSRRVGDVGKLFRARGLEEEEKKEKAHAEDGRFLRGEVRIDGELERLAKGGKGGGWRKENGNKAAVVQTIAENVDEAVWGGWWAEQIWGFEDVFVPGSGSGPGSGWDEEGYVEAGGKGDGEKRGRWERRYTRRIVLRDRSGGRVERARVVYDYIGPRQ